MQEGAMQHHAQVELGRRFFAQLDERSTALAPMARMAAISCGRDRGRARAAGASIAGSAS